MWTCTKHRNTGGLPSTLLSPSLHAPHWLATPPSPMCTRALPSKNACSGGGAIRMFRSAGFVAVLAEPGGPSRGRADSHGRACVRGCIRVGVHAGGRGRTRAYNGPYCRSCCAGAQPCSGVRWHASSMRSRQTAKGLARTFSYRTTAPGGIGCPFRAQCLLVPDSADWRSPSCPWAGKAAPIEALISVVGDAARLLARRSCMSSWMASKAAPVRHTEVTANPRGLLCASRPERTRG